MVVGRKCSVENLFEEVVLASYICTVCSKGWLMASHLWPCRVVLKVEDSPEKTCNNLRS